jgi:hypothetical protein
MYSASQSYSSCWAEVKGSGDELVTEQGAEQYICTDGARAAQDPSLDCGQDMWQDQPKHSDKPEKAGGEGWLINPAQQKLVQFQPGSATAHAQWVEIQTFRLKPGEAPMLITGRRMLRHNAIEAWQTMLKTGWTRCHPPRR